MPRGLRRFQQSEQTHFVTFSCYRRQPNFASCEIYNLFLTCLEQMRQRFGMYIYGYVVMPEHVHLLLNEPQSEILAYAIHYLKLSFAKRATRISGKSGTFWQKRYYDRNIRDECEFKIKLRYVHRNPIKRGLVQDAADWKWSSYRNYALREIQAVEIESEWTARDRESKLSSGRERIFLNPRLASNTRRETWGTRLPSSTRRAWSKQEDKAGRGGSGPE